MARRWHWHAGMMLYQMPRWIVWCCGLFLAVAR